MQPEIEHPITVHRRREMRDRSVNDRRLRRLQDIGEVRCVVAGSYVPAQEWAALTPRERHLTRVLEVADRTRSPQVLVGAAAAAVWRIERIAEWPQRVEVCVSKASGGRSSGDIRRRTRGFHGLELTQWRGHLVTTPAQTALDLAADSGFADGVIALDQVRWLRREGGPLTTEAELWAVLDRQRRRGMAKVPEMLRFSTALSDSVRESEGRVLLDRLGFPGPVLQRQFLLPSGRIAYPDYFFEDFDHAAEFDGTGKYFDPALLKGRTPRQALLEEKDRADELRRHVRALSRWRTKAHRDPRLLYDILTADGLPSTLPRPRAGAVLR